MVIPDKQFFTFICRRCRIFAGHVLRQEDVAVRHVKKKKQEAITLFQPSRADEMSYHLPL